MMNFVKADIYHDGESYCARCLDMDVFTQGTTLDEVVRNLKEAIQLHLEEKMPEKANIAPHASLFTMMDLGEIYA